MKTSLLILVATCASVVTVAGPRPVYGQDVALPLGTSLPGTDIQVMRDGKPLASISQLSGTSATVVLFWSNQCPWTRKYSDRVVDIVRSFSGDKVGFILVNSNDAAAFPKESAAENTKVIGELAIDVAYVGDPSGSLAKAFGATRNPEVFVFDSDRTLVYLGSIDDSPADDGTVTSEYLRDALTAIAYGSPVGLSQTKPFGCTIKFRR